MAEVTRRRTGELVRTLFQILLSEPEGIQAKDALQRLEKSVTLTSYEAGPFPSGDRRFEKIVRFATVDCVKAGWMIKHRGRWQVTEDGKAAYHRLTDPEAFYREAIKLYREWRRSQPVEEVEDTPEESSANKTASITLDQAEGLAWSAIEQYVRVMPPYEFQDLVADLLRAMGYYVGYVAPPGKDGGTDILAFNDPLGTRPPRIKVQVKRNFDSPRIDVNGLRSFMAVLHDDDVGLFVALSGFTKDAELEARSQAHRRITLIDLERLVDLWTEHYAKLGDGARRRLPLRPVWFLAGED